LLSALAWTQSLGLSYPNLTKRQSDGVARRKTLSLYFDWKRICQGRGGGELAAEAMGND
jgi:hypothetical protein